MKDSIFLSCVDFVMPVRSPLAEAAIACLLADMKAAHPEQSEAQIIAGLKAAPDLVSQCLDAFARHNPTLPRFNGSWKFRHALRQRLNSLQGAALTQPVLNHQPATPSRLSLIGGGVLLAIGLPMVVIAGLPTVELLTDVFRIGIHVSGSRAGEVTLNLLLAIGTGTFALAGAACAFAGGWLIRRYCRT